MVEDFGVKYVGNEHANYLAQAIGEHYKYTTDWTRRRYIGITINWDYTRRRVHLSIPGYVARALKQFQHTFPKKNITLPFPAPPSSMAPRNNALRNHQHPCWIKKETIHPTSVWQTPVPRMSSRQHNPVPSKRHHIAICSTYQGHCKADTTTP